MGSEPNPGGTAMPGRLVTELEQAPSSVPLHKLVRYRRDNASHIRYQTDKNRFYILILAKRPRSDS